ncbi:VirK/YbjX family protein [Dyella nitratireducens]|uniref:DUF535 domain-containing protein n=1 Tax=Dyella nitratireducens TaxID=1849580 RepID=A0ABQ1FPW3_9GAMM|nr:DUF535 family protein [Dyella nitratireducens]GGA25612.1 hypothetical protein GCM10010981_12750 [Dyella nitratireducens]GLQ43662.1 hypothetical protein GCM10007902_35120 [Dyella nitratireducens]
MNKPNRHPAGVLDIGLEAFLPRGAYAPDARRARTSPFFDRSRAAVNEAAQPGALSNLLESLRHRQDWTGPWYKRGVTALKYLLRSLGMAAQHQRFLALIAADPVLHAYRRRDPRLLERHMHRYVNAHWHRRDRLTYLQQHYRFAKAHLPSGLYELVYAMGHASLGSLTAKDGSLLTLCLRPPIYKGCEGELCLQLCDVNEEPLYSIVFSIADELPALMIGCLQGPRGDHAKDVVRELTRILHGMRPKQLMLSLVYTFARHYGIERMVAISNDAHPLRRSGRPLFSDYDAFWEEQRGQRIGGGWYALPASLPHKSEAEVPSNHRAAFRRREALRLEAEQLLLNALAPPVPAFRRAAHEASRIPFPVVAGSGNGP